MQYCLCEGFNELNKDFLMDIDGGTFWGMVSGVASVVAGAAEVAGGVVLICVPDPTTATKFGGAGAIATGVATISGGAVTIAQNRKK